ncbi:hypothetical protein B0H10DRAFT_1985098 [Mycena sp. CBHHK59/15]|nr:hypothetical protein B0H10DRAFT_1985098 [Mycena sp. CBHHK59/15]
MLPPRAYTFIGLNGLRILSIIGLLLVFSSNIVTLVHDIQAVDRFQAGKAAASDSGSTNTTTEDILHSDYIILGAAILSHHVDDFSLVSAFFLFAIGCLNLLAGLIFRQSAKSKRSITSWREHAKSALPTHVAGVDIRPVAAAAPSFVSSVFKSEEKPAEAKSGLGFGLQGERAAGLKGYLISKPLESLPRYAPKRSPSSA